MLNFRGTKGDKGESSRYVMQNALQGDIGLTLIENKITKSGKIILGEVQRRPLKVILKRVIARLLIL